jgi:hypothetical protein
MPYFLAFSRLGYISSQALLPVALALYLLYAGLRRQSLLYVTLGGVAAGLGFYTFTAGRLGLLVAAVFLISQVLGRIDWWRAGWALVPRWGRRGIAPGAPATGGGAPDTGLFALGILGAVFAAGCAMTVLPYQVYGGRVDPSAVHFKMAEAIFPNRFYVDALFTGDQAYRDLPVIRVGDQSLYVEPGLWQRLLVRGVFRSLLVFHHPGIISEHFIDGPLAGRGTAVLFFLGAALALGGVRRSHYALPVIWLAVGLAALSVLNTFPPRHTHLVPIIPVMAIFTALGVATVVEGLTAAAGIMRVSRGRPERTLRSRLSLLATAGLVALVAYAGLRAYFVDAQQRYRPDFEQALAFRVLELNAPRHVVYVAESADDLKFVPWVVRSMATPAEYQAVLRDDLQAGRFTIDPRAAYLFFFRERDRAVVVPFLENALRRAVVPREYRNREGVVVALAYAIDP